MGRFILLTALPKTGKSTAINKIAGAIGTDECHGFITKEVSENNERTGFEINTLSGVKATLSSIYYKSDIMVGKYGVNLEAFESVCLPELNHSNGIIFIDEIGPMQLHSQRFKNRLMELLNEDVTVIGTIYYESYPWVDDFKKMPQIELVEVTLENRNDIPEVVLAKLNQP